MTIMLVGKQFSTFKVKLDRTDYDRDFIVELDLNLVAGDKMMIEDAFNISRF